MRITTEEQLVELKDLMFLRSWATTQLDGIKDGEELRNQMLRVLSTIDRQIRRAKDQKSGPSSSSSSSSV